MADNKSKNSSLPNQLEQRGKEFLEGTAQERIARQRIAQEKYKTEQDFQALREGISGDDAAAVTRDIGKSLATQDRLSQRVEQYAETRLERGINGVQTDISRNFDRARSGVKGASMSSMSIGAGMREANTSYSDLESRQSRQQASMMKIESESMKTANQLYSIDPVTGQSNINKAAERKLGHLSEAGLKIQGEMAGTEAAMRMKRGLGEDPNSKMQSLLSVGQSAQSMLHRQGISDELRSGGGDVGGKNLNQLKQQEIQLATQLVAELEKLKNSAGSSAEELKKMTDTAQDTADKLEKTKEASSQLGSGSGGSNVANGFNMAAGAFGAIGGAIQQIGVGQRMGQVANVTGYAALENQKYQTYKAASGGDVASQLMLSQFGAAEGFGRELKATANVALGAYAAGGVAQGVAGGIRLASTTNILADTLNTGSQVNTGIQGAQDLLQGAATTAVAGSDLARGVTGGQTQIQATQAQLEARRQIMAVSAEQMQGFRDYGVGIGTAAISMGSRGGAFVNSAITKEAMSSMVSSRISPEQMAQMSQMGAQQIGSTFNQDQVFAARGLERSGFGTMQENMQRMSSLASAGSNNPQAGLSSVMEAAFSKSLDGSKVLNMMVENTGAMVQAGAGRALGIDTTSAAAQILAAGVDPNEKNQEFGMQRAMDAQERMRSIGTDAGMNFAAMSATARISKMTGLSGDEAIIAQKFTDSDLRGMKGMKPNEISNAMFEKGIRVKEGGEQELVAQLTKARLVTNLQLGGAGIAQGLDAEALADKKLRGEKFTKEEQYAFNKAAALGDFGSGSEAERAATAVVSKEPNLMEKGRAVLAMKGEGGTDQQKMLDDMRTQGFKQLSQAALEATKDFTTAADALKALGALAKDVENIGDKGGEGQFKGAAAESAKTFGASTTQFKESVGEFSSAIKLLVGKSGVSNANNDSAINELMRESKKASTK